MWEGNPEYGQTRCIACREAVLEKARQEQADPPPYERCISSDPKWGSCVAPPPDLSPRAAEVLALFRLCESQVLATSGVGFALNWTVVQARGREAGIRFTSEWWELFKALENAWRGYTNRPTAKEPSSDGSSDS